MRRNLDLTPTLFAIASGGLPSAVALLKLSGQDAFAIAGRVFRPASPERVFTRKREMWFGEFRSRDGERIDEGVLLSFVAPHSHTGEDTVEFHCHGAPAILQRLQEELLALGARPAERGEFSYRALQKGKLSPGDLETLGDLFLAKSPADLQAIYARKDGGLDLEVGEIRESLIRALAILDTAVDFTDEYSDVVPRSLEPIQAAIHGCSVITHRYSRLQEEKKAPILALVGRPNAGKSSLFNRVLGRYRAIVHAEPGTTRDVVEERIRLGGRTWTLTDTAGVRTLATGPEAEGIELGAQYLEGAAFWVLVVDGAEGLGPVETQLLERFGSRPHVVVWNKRDLPGWRRPPDELKAVEFSSLVSQDLAALISRWEVLLEEVEGGESGPIPGQVAAARLQEVLMDLKRVKEGIQKETPPEYLSEEIRLVLRKLESVIGEVDIEQVLDRVFGEFCIGK